MSQDPALAKLKIDRSTAIELFLLSFVSLFVELLVIRWLAADLRAFSVFKTFPLATCFVGLGVGYAIANEKTFRWVGPAFLWMVILLRLADVTTVRYWSFPSITDTMQTYILGANFWSYTGAFVGIMTLLLSAPFLVCMAIGAQLGSLFNRLEPLPAYTINIFGAILGSVAFAGLSFLCLPPWALMLPILAVVIWYQLSGKNKYWLSAACLTAALLVAIWTPNPLFPGTVTYWSPYQRLDLSPVNATVTKPGQPPKLVGLKLCSNSFFYQYVMDLSPENAALLPDRAEEVADLLHYYSLPYLLKSPEQVLIVGAGMGADVQEALKHNVKHVDAVEIDPVIIKLGIERNPAHAYADPRVTAITDDARHYFSKCPKKYDMIIFGLLDSHSTAGQSGSVRLDNFVYTKESIARAASLLKPDGMMMMCWGASAGHIPPRIFATIKEALGYEPVLLRNTRKGAPLQHSVYIVGKVAREKSFILPPQAAPFAIQPAPEGSARILTDDWPYVYLAPVLIDPPYLLVLAVVLLLSGFAARKAIVAGAREPEMWQMLFLGSAFLLLELQAISRLSLVYGATWFTSSIVIVCVLLLILFANLLVIKFGKAITERQRLLHICIVLSLLLSYCLPYESMLGQAEALTVASQLIVTFVTVLPMFIAGLIFASAFSKAEIPGKAISFNLFGAVIGAMLEYLSNYVGVNALVLIAAALYSCSLVSFELSRKR